MTHLVSLHDAEANLSSLVDRAAAGEEIVITESGVPRARLLPVIASGQRRVPAGAMRVEHIASDFDAPDLGIERLFGSETT